MSNGSHQQRFDVKTIQLDRHKMKSEQQKFDRISQTFQTKKFFYYYFERTVIFIK